MNSHEIDCFLIVRVRDFDGVFSIDNLLDDPICLSAVRIPLTNRVVKYVVAAANKTCFKRMSLIYITAHTLHYKSKVQSRDMFLKRI